MSCLTFFTVSGGWFEANLMSVERKFLHFFTFSQFGSLAGGIWTCGAETKDKTPVVSSKTESDDRSKRKELEVVCFLNEHQKLLLHKTRRSVSVLISTDDCE